MQRDSKSSALDRSQITICQRPFFTRSSVVGSLSSSLIDQRSASILSNNKSLVSPNTQKHYADNLYCFLDDGVNSRQRFSRSTFGGFYPILESLSGMEKMLITKQGLKVAKSKNIDKEVRYILENVDENLDSGDPFQSPGFSLNLKDSGLIEFKLVDINEPPTEAVQRRECCRIRESYEEKFNNKNFTITLRESEKNKMIGSVNMIDQAYHVFDANGNYLFQVEKSTNVYGEVKVRAIRKEVNGEKVEMGKADVNSWRRMTLETEVSYERGCNAKEKLLILGTMFVIIMKMSGKEAIVRANTEDNCSVGGLWREVMAKMRSIF